MFDIQDETVYLLILIPGVQNAWMAGGCFRPGSKKFMGSQESPDGRLSAASQCCLLVQVIRKCTRSSFAYLPGINSCFRSSTAFMAHSAMREVPARTFGFFAGAGSSRLQCARRVCSCAHSLLMPGCGWLWIRVQFAHFCIKCEIEGVDCAGWNWCPGEFDTLRSPKLRRARISVAGI